jgi:hypothetical protein
MHIQIDTGSRLDQSGDTTFAFSNDIEKVILLKQTVRDEVLAQIPGEKLKRQLRLFAACVFLLIQDHLNELRQITIDREYPGHDEEIQWLILNMIKQRSFGSAGGITISFAGIGRQSQAHKVAWETYRGKRKPNQILTTKDILAVLFP